MSEREVMVVSGTRTAIGDYGGALKDLAATRLGCVAIKEAVARAKVDPASVGHVVMGSVIHGEARDMYLSRVAAVDAGLPVDRREYASAAEILRFMGLRQVRLLTNNPSKSAALTRRGIQVVERVPLTVPPNSVNSLAGTEQGG